MDGWDKKDKIVFEFLGCLWHGCPKCYPNKRDIHHSIMPHRTPNEAHRATMEKLKRLKEAGHEVKSIWECEWKKVVEKDEEVKRMVSGLERVNPLEPRVPLRVIIVMTLEN